MTFNAPVYGAAGNIEGNQIISALDQDFDALLNDYKTFFNDLQQKYPPQRWQNFLNLKRLWNGGKKATFKIGERFTEESFWGKAAIAFLAGVMEESE
jgi:hypothetical protein